MEIKDLVKPTAILETDKVFCCIHNSDTFYIYYKPSALIEIDDTKLVFDHYEKNMNNGPMKVIAEMGPYSSMDKKSREYLQNHKVPAICEAAVINGLGQRLLINFYYGVKKHNHPSKAFSNREKALKWVASFD